MHYLRLTLSYLAISILVLNFSATANVVNSKKYRIYGSKKTGTQIEKDQKWFLEVESLVVNYNSSTNYRTLLNIKKCPEVLDEYGRLDEKKCSDLTNNDYYDSRFVSALHDGYRGKEYLGITIEAYVTMGIMPAIKKIAGKTVLRLLPKFKLTKTFNSMKAISVSGSINKNISLYANKIKNWVSAQNLAPQILKSVTNGTVSVTSWLGQKIVSFVSWMISFLILMEVWRIIDPLNTFENGAKADEVKFQKAKNLLAQEINHQFANEDIDKMGESIKESLKIANGRWFNQKQIYPTCDKDLNNNPVIIGNSICYVDPIMEAYEYNTAFEILYLSGMDPR